MGEQQWTPKVGDQVRVKPHDPPDEDMQQAFAALARSKWQGVIEHVIEWRTTPPTYRIEFMGGAAWMNREDIEPAPLVPRGADVATIREQLEQREVYRASGRVWIGEQHDAELRTLLDALDAAEAKRDALEAALEVRQKAFDDAALQWRAMREKLHRHMAECNGRIRIKALDYRATKDEAISHELDIETAFRNGLHNSLADLDHFFPTFFYMFYDEDGEEIQKAGEA